MSVLRRELISGNHDDVCPEGGTAYLLIYQAVREQPGLIHGKLKADGAYCAVGSYFHDHEGTALPSDLIDEVALVNDSMPTATPAARKRWVQQWLRWKLSTLGMPGFTTKAAPIIPSRKAR
jgi:hypothetical protein